MKTILIATTKSWNIANAVKLTKMYQDKYHVRIITCRHGFNRQVVDYIKPDFIFLPHWSWIVPPEIYDNYTCIAFHITDLPFGRGGSPLQNLIERKIYHTKISAFRVIGELDAGDVYLKTDLDISDGNCEYILSKASKEIFFKMIPFIIETDPRPVKQQGYISTFQRRKPYQSNLLTFKPDTLDDLYDFIRMLDGEGYPKAYIDIGKFRLELSETDRKFGKLAGRFEITEKGE
jgi:methionyl-tRNA formyltransferase